MFKNLENIDNVEELQNAHYEDIFSQNIDDQIRITKIFIKVFKIRNILLKKKE